MSRSKPNNPARIVALLLLLLFLAHHVALARLGDGGSSSDGGTSTQQQQRQEKEQRHEEGEHWHHRKLFRAPAGSSAGKNRFIVVIEDDDDPEVDADLLIRSTSSRVEKFFSHSRPITGFVVADIDDDDIKRIVNFPGVRYAEQDQVVSIAGSTDTQNDAPWGLDRIDRCMEPLDGTYKYPDDDDGDGGEVDIYIFDTGVDVDHPDFDGRAFCGFDLAGVKGGKCRDRNGHGTHVAGVAAGRQSGVAKTARIVAVRILGSDGGGSVSDIITGLEWLVDQQKLPANSGRAMVANLSISTTGISIALNEAVDRAVRSGITVVVAAGNDSNDACEHSPAASEGGITVGATNSLDEKSQSSNYGPCVTVFAPGSRIVSAVPGGGFDFNGGTSMAAPHVSGVAALHLKHNPNHTPDSVKKAIVRSAATGAVKEAGSGSPDLLVCIEGLLQSSGDLGETPNDGDKSTTDNSPGSVMQPPPPPPPPPASDTPSSKVVRFYLENSNGERLFEIHSGMTFSLNDLPSHAPNGRLNILAVTEPSTVGRVSMQLSKSPSTSSGTSSPIRSQTENHHPYELAGTRGGIDLPRGELVLEAIPTLDDERGQPLLVTFTVR